MSIPTLQDVHPTFVRAFNDADLDALVSLYEADAMLCPQPGTTVTGHDAIREVFRGLLALNPVMNMKTEAVFYSASGLALLHGRWSMLGTRPDGTEARMNGRNSEVLRRQPDGGWLFVVDNPFTP